MDDSSIDPMERSDLQDPAVREKLLAEHPLINKPYVILTPMIEEAYRIMRERVWLRRTGSYMHSQPRMGKTTCAEMISELLLHEFPSIVLSRISAEGGKGDVSLVRDIASSMGIGLRGRPDYKGLLEKVLLFIRAESSAHKGNQFVLMVDEMQNLREADYKVLISIHNRLGMAGIMMTTLGFAQPEINQQRSALLATSARNIIARFLSEPIQFWGCLNSEGLKYILRGYDESKCFPRESKWTYTRFFLPQAYGAGFRLATYTDPIWASLSTASAALGAGSVPMEHLTRTIENLLLAGRLKDSEKYVLTLDEIEVAVSASNLEGFSSVMNDGA